MCTRRGRGSPRRQGGLTLIELIVFIVIVSVGLAGVLSVFNVAVKGSADPMIRKQMLSIAEALLEEVELQPFTYCDPTDATWGTATSATTGSPPTTCTATVQGLGPGGTGQARTGGTPFNNVADYHGLNLSSPITDINDNAAAPAGYSASISIVPSDTLGGTSSAACTSGTDCTAMKLVRIVVTVTRGSESLVLEGYRARYWPNDATW